MAELAQQAAIAAIAVLYAAAAIVIGNKFGGRKRLKVLQKDMQEYQKQVAEATKSSDESRLKQLQLRDKEMMGVMTEMMWLPWKSAIFILPIFFLLAGTGGFLGVNFDGVLSPAFPGFEATLPFELHPSPLFAGVSLNPLSWPNVLFNLAKRGVYGAKGFFIAFVIIAGLALEAIVSRLESKPAAQESKPAAQETKK